MWKEKETGWGKKFGSLSEIWILRIFGILETARIQIGFYKIENIVKKL